MLLTNKFLKVVSLVTCHIQGVPITIFKDDEFLFIVPNFHNGCAMANTNAMYTMYYIIPLFWCDKVRFWLKHRCATLFSNALRNTNDKHFQVRITKSVFNGERCDNNTLSPFKTYVSIMAICCIDISVNKTLCHCSCLFFIATGEQDFIAIFYKLTHIGKYASCIKIILVDWQAFWLYECLWLKHRIGQCKGGETDLSPQKKLSFYFVEIDDCIYVTRQNFVVFNEMLQSAPKFLS